MELVSWAAAEAERLLQPLGQRWLHVCAVADVAGDTARRLDMDVDLLASAAWLHDIGYAPAIALTGFHPLDGARHLRRLGVDERVIALVAHHSSAAQEAAEVGLAFSAEFPAWRGEYHQALDFCDMTVGPNGERMAIEDRIRDILERYDPGTAVHRAMQRADPQLRATVALIERKLEIQSQ